MIPTITECILTRVGLDGDTPSFLRPRRGFALVQRSAIFVDKILTGASPAELPIEQASKFELVINVKAAKILGIEIPSAVCCEPTK